MSEDKLTHVLVPVEWIADTQYSIAENANDYGQGQKMILEKIVTKFEHFNPAAQQVYIKESEQLLINLEEYFDDRSDADNGVPNKEMQLLSEIRRLQQLLNNNK